jgi:hypothetical protein
MPSSVYLAWLPADPHGWYDVIDPDDDLTPTQERLLVERLRNEEEAAVNAALPMGVRWEASQDRVYGPRGTVLPRDLQNLLSEARRGVLERYRSRSTQPVEDNHL